MREELKEERGGMFAATAHMLGSMLFAAILWSQLYGNLQASVI